MSQKNIEIKKVLIIRHINSMRTYKCNKYIIYEKT